MVTQRGLIHFGLMARQLARYQVFCLAFCLACCLAAPGAAQAQSQGVEASDLQLTVRVEPLPATPMRQEMILLTIHGIYKRHITLERLEQPDFAGFNWVQLGEDHWFESMLDGRPVKNMRRRMAIFPNEAGLLDIAPFRHHLTLLDKDNKWFEHTVSSNPVSLSVDPEAQNGDWWFPVRRLRVADNWSNAPDQLQQGAGVLRVVRISALGASPDMIPPMPELKSPSALIFAHPEKRLVDLTPYGPEAIAYWRWTVTPTNGHAAILEPIEFSYFDTFERKTKRVVISAQRVAFGDATPPPSAGGQAGIATVALNPGLLATVAGVAFGLSVVMAGWGRRASTARLRTWGLRQRRRHELRRAARRSDVATVRRAAHLLDALYAPSEARHALLAELDTTVFAPAKHSLNLRKFSQNIIQSCKKQ
ncbi:BatD family protein [Pseudophaeobacter leonis]|uniref:BatD family protein n=1 Tax=Pseudophaeobacter leonis TaxID=1144477 RepID=UPI0009F3AC91|nr:BatD family protein [Pseudophaeobacter leonis]